VLGPYRNISKTNEKGFVVEILDGQGRKEFEKTQH